MDGGIYLFFSEARNLISLKTKQNSKLHGQIIIIFLHHSSQVMFFYQIWPQKYFLEKNT
jgi:hypothetical protein